MIMGTRLQVEDVVKRGKTAYDQSISCWLIIFNG